jgi:hypothetical protein
MIGIVYVTTALASAKLSECPESPFPQLDSKEVAGVKVYQVLIRGRPYRHSSSAYNHIH